MFESKRARNTLLTLALLWLSLTAATECRAQVEHRLHLSGLAYLDYYYILAAPSNNFELAGENGFTYRRLYLTADYKLSEAFSGRARLEANDGSIQPFVKDLYLRWTLSSRHDLRFGVIPTPAVELSESVWGFRSLEKTPLDLFGLVSSRDMGVRFDGTSSRNEALGYNVMFANDHSVYPEDDPHKRLYGLIHASPAEHLLVAIGADYGWHGGGRKDEYRVSGLAGYTSPTLRVGLESFWSRTGRVTTAGTEFAAGISLYASGWFSPVWGLVGRMDHLQWRNRARIDQTYATLGVVYQPDPNVRFIPNLYLLNNDVEPDPLVTARITLEARF